MLTAINYYKNFTQFPSCLHVSCLAKKQHLYPQKFQVSMQVLLVNGMSQCFALVILWFLCCSIAYQTSATTLKAYQESEETTYLQKVNSAGNPVPVVANIKSRNMGPALPSLGWTPVADVLPGAGTWAGQHKGRLPGASHGPARAKSVSWCPSSPVPAVMVQRVEGAATRGFQDWSRRA